MRIGFHITCVALGLFLGSFLMAQSATPALDEVVAKVGRNVVQLRDTLPDFVCAETITSRIVENGKMTKQKVIDSLFTGARTKQLVNKTSIDTIVETREVVAVDGKAVRKGTKFPDAPFLPKGLTANALFIVFPGNGSVATFSPDYKAIGRENVGGLSTFQIEFEDKKPLVESLRKAGTAWIDLNSMQVVRMELHFLGFARSSVMDDFDAYSILTDYAEADIGGTLFWLPKSVRVEGKRTKSGNPDAYIARYLAEYANCRRFDVSVGITYGNDPAPAPK